MYTVGINEKKLVPNSMKVGLRYICTCSNEYLYYISVELLQRLGVSPSNILTILTSRVAFNWTPILADDINFSLVICNIIFYFDDVSYGCINIICNGSVYWVYLCIFMFNILFYLNTDTYKCQLAWRQISTHLNYLNGIILLTH